MSQDRIDALSRSLADSTSRRGMLRLLGVGVAGTAITAVGLNEVQAERKEKKAKKAKKTRAAKPGGGTLTGGDVTGTAPLGPVTGTFTPTAFANQGGDLVAIGTFTSTAGSAVTGTQQIALPVNLIQGTCQVLHLELGPLDLNLLGLEVHLDKVVLDITANPAGGLLGQLLCAIANLLNGGSPLNQLIGLLNRLLAALGL
jgi:hypothetical protein